MANEENVKETPSAETTEPKYWLEEYLCLVHLREQDRQSLLKAWTHQNKTPKTYLEWKTLIGK